MPDGQREKWQLDQKDADLPRSTTASAARVEISDSWRQPG
jgi:hypothetical protein